VATPTPARSSASSDTGDLLPGIQNFAAILHGFGEYAINPDGTPILDVDGNYTAPMFPYDTLCVNPAVPDGLRCGAKPFIPVAEFYKDNGDGTLTQQMVAGSYGPLGSGTQYTAFFDYSQRPKIGRKRPSPKKTRRSLRPDQ
jgi:hypothetical protein